MAARLIHASLTEDKFATDGILARAVEANLDGLFFGFTFHTGVDEGDVEQAVMVFVDDHAGTAGVALGVKADPGYEPSSCRSSITSHSRSSSGARSFSCSVIVHPSRSGAAVSSRTNANPGPSAAARPAPLAHHRTVTRPVAPSALHSPGRKQLLPHQDRRPCGQRTPNSRQAV